MPQLQVFQHSFILWSALKKKQNKTEQVPLKIKRYKVSLNTDFIFAIPWTSENEKKASEVLIATQKGFRLQWPSSLEIIDSDVITISL